jgi:hypothetical protein
VGPAASRPAQTGCRLFFIIIITLIKENPKEIEPKSITDFEVPELAIDFEESEPITDF